MSKRPVRVLGGTGRTGHGERHVPCTAVDFAEHVRGTARAAVWPARVGASQ